MPGFTTHYLFGVNNFRHLQRKSACGALVQSIGRHKTVFQLGLQGPDIFFYHLSSQVRKDRPGSIAHTSRTGDFLSCLIESPELFWAGDEKEIAQSYVSGFIGHYILDTQMHPYVYYMTGSGDALKKKGYASHIALESDIDAALLMRYAKCLPSQFPSGKTISFDSHTRAIVADILYFVYHNIFPELELRKPFLSRAILSMQIGARLIYNPHNYKRHLFGMAEQIIFGHPVISPVIPSDHLTSSEDPLNLQHKKWHNPWAENSCSDSSVPQMIKKASSRYMEALGLLNSLYTADAFTEESDVLKEKLKLLIGQQSFHTGLDWVLGE